MLGLVVRGVVCFVITPTSSDPWDDEEEPCPWTKWTWAPPLIGTGGGAALGLLAGLMYVVGENLAGNVGINLAFGLLTTAVVILGIALVVGAAMVGGPKLALVVTALAVVAVAFVAVVQAALSGISAAAVYRYAVDGQAPEGFSGGELQDAFRQK